MATAIITDEKIYTCGHCHKKKPFPDMALIAFIFKGKRCDCFICKKCWETELEIGKGLSI
jgi:hypothetical protein